MPVAEKKLIMSSLDDIKREIKVLESKRSELEKTLEMFSSDNDRAFLLKHWEKLAELQQQYSPRLFKNIVVSCFDLWTSVCTCQAGCRRFIYAADLFDLWNEGFAVDGKPIVEIRFYNGREPLVFYIDGGRIASKNISAETALSRWRMIKQKPSPKERFSLTAISDINLKSLI